MFTEIVQHLEAVETAALESADKNELMSDVSESHSIGEMLDRIDPIGLESASLMYDN